MSESKNVPAFGTRTSILTEPKFVEVESTIFLNGSLRVMLKKVILSFTSHLLSPQNKQISINMQHNIMPICSKYTTQWHSNSVGCHFQEHPSTVLFKKNPITYQKNHSWVLEYIVMCPWSHLLSQKVMSSHCYLGPHHDKSLHNPTECGLD